MNKKELMEKIIYIISEKSSNNRQRIFSDENDYKGIYKFSIINKYEFHNVKITLTNSGCDVYYSSSYRIKRVKYNSIETLLLKEYIKLAN